MKKRMTYRDALPLRHRMPLPAHFNMRILPKPGNIELLPGGGRYVHK